MGKKSQHPSWLNKHWKQCEQCRAFTASQSAHEKTCVRLSGMQRNNNYSRL